MRRVNGKGLLKYFATTSSAITTPRSMPSGSWSGLSRVETTWVASQGSIRRASASIEPATCETGSSVLHETLPSCEDLRHGVMTCAQNDAVTAISGRGMLFGYFNRATSRFARDPCGQDTDWRL